eukprot:s10706_g1.t1
MRQNSGKSKRSRSHGAQGKVLGLDVIRAITDSKVGVSRAFGQGPPVQQQLRWLLSHEAAVLLLMRMLAILTSSLRLRVV